MAALSVCINRVTPVSAELWCKSHIHLDMTVQTETTLQKSDLYLTDDIKATQIIIDKITFTLSEDVHAVHTVVKKSTRYEDLLPNLRTE